MRSRVLLFTALTLILGSALFQTASHPAGARQSCVTPPAGAAGWYPLDGNALDVQGGAHAALSGAPAFAAGKVGQALQFDGADDSAKAPASSGLNVGPGAGLTIALWINPADGAARPLVEWNSGVISGCDFCPIGTHLWTSQSNGAPGVLYASLVNVQGGSQNLQSAAGVITAAAYQHVALTYDKASGVARLYRNGGVVAEQTVGSFTPQTSYDLYFGFRPAGSGLNSRYRGALDEVQLFDRALTQADIQTIYNAGDAGTALCRPPDTIQFLTTTLAVNEVNGSASVAVARTGSPAGAATVQYATTAGGTATAGLDFTPVSGTLSFALGEVTKTITIPVNADSVTEPDETIEVVLSNPTGGAGLGSPSTATVTVADPRSTTQPGRILTSTGAAQGGLIEFNPDGSNRVNLTPDPSDGGCGDPVSFKDAHPSASRDGKLIAFQSTRGPNGGGKPRIFVMNADGTNVRQLTFNVPSGEFQAGEVRDVNPVISPDGSSVAFISNRSVHDFPPSPGAPSGSQYRPNDLYIVNTDGTGLRRVTNFQPNAGPGGVPGSNVVSAAWSPDGARLAFRGVRRPIENGAPASTFNFVVHTIGADGTGEATVAVHPTTGQSEALDWSDAGISYLWGGEAQGAPERRLVIGGAEFLTSQFPEIADAPGTAGALRVSPGGARIGWVSGQGRFVSVGVGATGRTETAPLGLSAGEPFWWQPGAPLNTPGRLEVGPDPVTVWENGSVQMSATLFDSQGNVLARTATAWRLDNCSGGTARVSPTGLVTARPDLNYTGQVCASNGGVSDCAALQNFDIPILSVSATTPAANTSGAGGPGVFTITRAGNPTGALVVAFATSGTAVRDADYALSVGGNTVTMAPDQTSVTVSVQPTGGSAGKGDKTVVLTLQPEPSNAYAVDGQRSAATVTVKDDGAPAALSLSSVTPNRGGDAGTVTVNIYGQHIKPGATATLKRAGQPDINGSGPGVAANGTSLSATFDLTGRARGAWDVVVSNPGGQTATLGAAFTIQEATGAQVWVDVVGRYTFRSGLEQKFYVVYGNRGDIDAEPTRIRLVVPAGLDITAIPRLADGGRANVTRTTTDSTLEFYVPTVPAGASVFVPLQLTTTPQLAHQTAKLRVSSHSAPGLRSASQQQPDPGVSLAAESIGEVTNDHLNMLLHVADSAGSGDLRFEITVVDADHPVEPSFEITEVGDEVEFRFTVAIPKSALPAQNSLAAGGKTAGRAGGRPAAALRNPVWDWVSGKITGKKDLWDAAKKSDELINKHRATLSQKELVDCLRSLGIIPTDSEAVGAKSFAGSGDFLKVGEVAAGLVPAEAAPVKVALKGVEYSLSLAGGAANDQYLNQMSTSLCGFAGSAPAHPSFTGACLVIAQNFGSTTQDALNARRTAQYALIQKAAALCFGCQPPAHPRATAARAATRTSARASSPDSCSPPQDDEKEINLTIVFSADPNEKSGSQGAGAQHYITGVDPLNYAVFFENKPEATAPAQTVVITDQLDASKFDLSTFALGAYAFGDEVVAVPPGLSDHTADVDLRPANNLIVRINADLNDATGLLTVRFTSLDPATMQPTEDPLAGFLPPNKKSPEGQGSVIFSVRPKPGLADGAEIRNTARIVFDANAPIDTPSWLNTIDHSRPTSKVNPLPAAQPSVVFNVTWAGADAGSGVKGYDVYVSEDGGPYLLWLDDAAQTSAYYTGRPQKTYSFYTLAADHAGNEEAAKTAAEATTATRTDIANPIDDARFFVRQHYLDFLSREPDQSGWDFWTQGIESCGSDAQCREVRRINTSAAFFLSIEFQQTGFLVHRAHKAAYGDLPGKPAPVTRSEFLPDTQAIGQGVVVLQPGWEQVLEANKAAYFDRFVTTARFAQAYPQAMSPEQYVDALNANAGGALSQPERDALVADLKNNAKTRAQALRALAEDADLARSEFNRAFVLMQYFGYLRRDPDSGPDADFTGYNFWLAKLNQFGGDYIRAEMVKAFLASIEYRKRFGQ